mmetsp:Transcript_2505/g.3890  ORF Transcript_2505/g.3890 Transcript_2505/m.3890 type:complete len:85 (-) Transcript_2505:126-380(-)
MDFPCFPLATEDALCSGCWLMVIPNIAPKLTSECCCAWIQPQVALSCGRNAKVVQALYLSGSEIESSCCVMRRVETESLCTCFG